MRRYLRHFVAALSVGLCGVSVLCAAAAIAASSAPPGSTVIGETTLFTWQFVVLLTSQVGVGAAFYAAVRAHICNTDIHRGYQELCEDFMPRVECEKEHPARKAAR